jgi:hypothetical protein
MSLKPDPGESLPTREARRVARLVVFKREKTSKARGDTKAERASDWAEATGQEYEGPSWL